MNSELERKRVFGEEPDWERASGKLSCRGEGGPEILCGGESKALPPCSRWHHRAIPFWCSISNNRHLLNPRKEGLLRSSGPGLRSSQRRLSATLKQQRILKSARTGRGGAISLPSTLLKIARHECQSWTHPALPLAGVVLSNFPSWTVVISPFHSFHMLLIQKYFPCIHYSDFEFTHFHHYNDEYNSHHIYTHIPT